MTINTLNPFITIQTSHKKYIYPWDICLIGRHCEETFLINNGNEEATYPLRFLPLFIRLRRIVDRKPSTMAHITKKTCGSKAEVSGANEHPDIYRQGGSK